MPDRQHTHSDVVEDDDLLQFLDDHEHASSTTSRHASPGGC
ncbi:hypothetical protein [Mitsuaria sp. TWR114]|nr:hypothetical protein [Mitsuaria sp. TWR114]